VVSIASAIAATTISGGAGSYALIDRLKDALKFAETRSISMSLETVSLVSVVLAATSQSRLVGFVQAVTMRALDSHGLSGSEASTPRDLADRALSLAAGARALAEMTMTYSSSLGKGQAEQRLFREIPF